MQRVIGMVGSGVVVFGDETEPLFVGADSGIPHSVSAVIWESGTSTPMFSVIGYAANPVEGVEMAQAFARECGLPFSDFRGFSFEDRANAL